MRFRLLALGTVAIVSVAVTAQGSAQTRTTAPPVVVPIKITITDTAIYMSPKWGQRGEVGRFILVNKGKKLHTFEFGHLRHGTGTQTGFKRTLKPSEQAILVLFLDYRGLIPYRSSQPYDLANPRMKGTFRIT